MKVGVRQLLALTIVAIEFTWAYPWVLLVSGTFYGPSAAPLLPPASAFALLTLAYLAVRAAVTRPWSLRDTRVMIVAAGFLSGMTAVRLAYCPGLLMLWEETHADPAQALAANRHWLLLLLGVVGVIFVSAAGLATAVHVEFRPALARLLRPLAPLAEALFYALFAVAMVVARALVFVFARLPFRRMISPTPSAAPPSFRDLLKDLPPQLVSGARWGMVALAIAVLVILVAVSVVRARRRMRRNDEDERESVWSSQLALSGLGEAWRRVWRRLRPAGREHEVAAVGAIRAIYREMLRIGAAADSPRARHQTPHEDRPGLAGRLPAPGVDSEPVAEAYVRARYSPRLPELSEIAGAREALERIKTSASP